MILDSFHLGGAGGKKPEAARNIIIDLCCNYSTTKLTKKQAKFNFLLIFMHYYAIISAETETKEAGKR